MHAYYLIICPRFTLRVAVVTEKNGGQTDVVACLIVANRPGMAGTVPGSLGLVLSDNSSQF